MTLFNKDFIQINDFSKDNFERAYLFVKSKEKEQKNIFIFFKKCLKNKNQKQEKHDVTNTLKQLDIKYLEKDFIEKEVLDLQEKDAKNRKEIETFLSIEGNKESSVLNVIEFNGKHKIIASEIKEIVDVLNKSAIFINNHKINEENIKKVKSILNTIKNNLQKINAKHLLLRMNFIENNLAENLNKSNSKSEQLYFSYYLIQELLLLEKHLASIYQFIMEKNFDQIKEIYFEMKYHDYFYKKEVQEYEQNFKKNEGVEQNIEIIQNNQEPLKNESLETTTINQTQKTEIKKEKTDTALKDCQNVNCYKTQTSKLFKKLKGFYEKVKMDTIYNIFLNMTVEMQYLQKDVIGFFVKMLLIAFGLVYFLEEFDNIIFTLLTIVLAFSYLTPFVFLFNKNWFVELTEEERKEYGNSIKELYDIEEVDLSIIKNRFELIHFLNKKIYLIELTK